MPDRPGPPAPLHYSECFGAFANTAFRIEIWIGLSSFSERRHPLSAPLLRAAVCHVNNKCTQCGDLPQAAGLWCILILLHVSLYYSPSFIWIKEEEFKNGQCGTMGIQIASIYCAEWWSGCPLCPSPSQDTVQLPIKPKKRVALCPSHSLCRGDTNWAFVFLTTWTDLLTRQKKHW